MITSAPVDLRQISDIQWRWNTGFRANRNPNRDAIHKRIGKLDRKAILKRSTEEGLIGWACQAKGYTEGNCPRFAHVIYNGENTEGDIVFTDVIRIGYYKLKNGRVVGKVKASDICTL